MSSLSGAFVSSLLGLRLKPPSPLSQAARHPLADGFHCHTRRLASQFTISPSKHSPVDIGLKVPIFVIKIRTNTGRLAMASQCGTKPPAALEKNAEERTPLWNYGIHSRIEWSVTSSNHTSMRPNLCLPHLLGSLCMISLEGLLDLSQTCAILMTCK